MKEAKLLTQEAICRLESRVGRLPVSGWFTASGMRAFRDPQSIRPMEGETLQHRIGTLLNEKE